jgi:hypothetical protein
MKNIYSLLLILMIAAFYGCTNSHSSESEVQLEKAANNHVVIFVDKSISVNFDKIYQNNGFEEKMRKFLVNKLENNGDKVAIYLVHENTVGTSAVQQINLSISNTLIKQINEGGPLDQSNAKSRIRDLRRKSIENVMATLKTEVEKDNKNPIAYHTDLWGSMEVAARHFKDVPVLDHKYIVYISDMVESSKGPNRRDFHKNKLQSKEEAEAFSKADIGNITSLYKVPEGKLKNAEVLVLFATDNNVINQNKQLRYYWEGIFEGFGMRDVRFE